MLSLFLVFVVIVVANAAPILVRFIIGDRLQNPVDFHQNFLDGKRIFGNTKTWIGLISIPVAGITAAWMLSLGLEVGVLVGLGVMAGDLFSSFIKRRIDMPESSMAIGLDQVPESLFPYLLLMEQMHFTWMQILIGVVCFIIFELLVSQFLFYIKVRNRPY